MHYTVTQFLPDHLEQLLVFTRQVMDQGSAWTEDLSIQVANKEIHLEINAVLLDDNILLSCEDSSVIFARRYRSNIK
ncbi:MAG: hypothetical protein ACI8R9_000611 [Paraglaciecola sp.]|jgi:hypothetical protein